MILGSKMCFSGTPHSIFDTPDSKNRFLRYYPLNKAKLCVISGGVDIGEFKPSNSNEKINSIREKLKLKEDADGNKVSSVQGIRAACKVMKSRYSKPFEGVQIKIPYETGMDPYSGMLEMLESKGIVEKVGNKLSYISPVTGEEIKEFRKQWTDERLQLIIDEWGQNPKAQEEVEDLDPDVLEPDMEDYTDES